MVLRRTSQSLLVALLVVLVAAALLTLLPRRAGSVVVRADAVGPFIAEGETPQLRNFFGFRGVEQADETPFRWTSGEASFVARNGARLGAPLLLDAHLCGCRTDGAPAPRLTLRANGAPLVETATTARWDEWRRYRVLLPPGDQPGDDLLVEFLSDYVPNAATGTPLGVAFHRASIAAIGPQRAYSPTAALGLALLVGGVSYIALLGGLARWQALLVGGLALILAAAQGYIGAQWLPVWVLTAPLVLAMGAVAFLWQKTKPKKSNRNTVHRVIVSSCQLVILSLPILFTQLLGTWILDDAYISFRYARNALLGHGFVFNPGERVEGYTNFLWTALFVPVISAGLDPAMASQVITLGLALLIVALTWAGARRVAGTGASLAALTLLVTSAPFLLYTARGSGMETALFTLLVLAGVLTTDHQPPTTDKPANQRTGEPVANTPFTFAGILLGLAAMTRPEGVLVAGTVGLHLLWQARRTGNTLRSVVGHRSSVVRFTLGFLLLFGPYYLWRYSYYGYPLPNTFYAKVGGTGAQTVRGLEYAANFALAQWPLVVLALGFTIYDCTHYTPRTTRHALRTTQLIIPLYTLYIIAVGGDHFPYYRFFVPLLPLVTIVAAAGLHALGTRLPQRYAVPAVAVLIFAGLSYHAPQLYASRTLNADGRVWGENSVVEKNREIGLWLRANTPPDTLIATGIAGALPYYSERPVLDALGLNDLHIAHIHVPTMGAGTAGAEKTDVPYILSRRPAYIPFNSVEPFLADPTFAASYQRMTVRGAEGRAVRLYRRADLPAPHGSREATP